MPSFECHHCLRHAPIKYVSKKEFVFSIGIGDIADVSVKQNFDSKFVNRKEMKVLFTIWITVVLIQEVVPSALIRLPRDATNRLSSVQTEYEAKYAQKGKHGNESYSTVRGKQEFHHDNCGENWNDFAEKCASLIKELIGSLAGVVSSQPGDATNLQLHIKNNFKHFDSSHNCSCFNHSKNALSDLGLTSLFNNLKAESTTSEKDKVGCKNQPSHEKGHKESNHLPKEKSHSCSQNQNVETPPLGALTMPEHPSMNPENAEVNGDGSNLCNRRQANYPYNVLKNSDSFTHSQTTTPKNFPSPIFSGQTPKYEDYPTLSPNHPSVEKNNFLPTSATIQPVYSTVLTPLSNLNAGPILSNIQNVKDSIKHQIGSLLQNTNVKSSIELSLLQSTTHKPPQSQEKSFLPSSHSHHQSSNNDCNQNKGGVLPADAKMVSPQISFMPQVSSENPKQGELSSERIPNNFKFQHPIQQPEDFQPSHQFDSLHSKGHHPSSTESIKTESSKKEKSYQTPEFFPSVGVTPFENQLKPCTESGDTTKRRTLATTFNPMSTEFLLPADALDKKPLKSHKSVEDSTQTPFFTFPTTQNPSVSAEITQPEYQHQKPSFPYQSLNLNSKQSILPKPIKMPHSHLSFPDSIYHKAEPTFSIPLQSANQQSLTTPSGFPSTSFDEEKFQLSSSVTPKTENGCDKNKPNGLTTPGILPGHLSQPNLPYLPKLHNPVLPSLHEDLKMPDKKNHEKEKPAKFPSQTAFGVTDGKLSQPDSNNLFNDKLPTTECESRGTTKNGETTENDTTDTPDIVSEGTHELINKPNPNDLHHEKNSETSNCKSDLLSTPPINIFESIAPTESQSDFHIFHAHKTKVTQSPPLDVSSHSQEEIKENKEQLTHSSTIMPTDFSDTTDCPNIQNNPDENSFFNPKTPIPESSVLEKEKDPEHNEEKKLPLIVPQEFSNQSNQPKQKNQMEFPNFSTSPPEEFSKKKSSLPDENEEKFKDLVTLPPVKHNKQSPTSNTVDPLNLDENKFLTPSPKEENENHSTVQSFTTEPTIQTDEENHKGYSEEDDVPGDKKSHCTDSESNSKQNKNSDQEKIQPSDSVPNPQEEDHAGPKTENHLQDLPSVTPSDSKPSLPVSGIFSQPTTSSKVNPVPVHPTIPIKPTAGAYPNYEDVASLKPTTFQTTSVEPTSPKINNHLPTPIITRPFLQTSSPYTPVESDEDVSIRPPPSSTLVYPIHKKPFHDDDEDEDDCCSCESCREGEVKNPREYRGTVCKDLEEARRELKAIFDKIKKKLKCGRKTLSTINPH